MLSTIIFKVEIGPFASQLTISHSSSRIHESIYKWEFAKSSIHSSILILKELTFVIFGRHLAGITIDVAMLMPIQFLSSIYNYILWPFVATQRP